jgi:hypothetical protein
LPRNLCASFDDADDARIADSKIPALAGLSSELDPERSILHRSVLAP